MRILGFRRCFPLLLAIWCGASCLLSALSGAAPAAPPGPEATKVQERKTSFFVYVGQSSETDFHRIIRFDTDFQPSWIAVVGLTRELTTIGRHLVVGAEAQLGQHWGRQNHQELNGLLVLRWTHFPWNEALPTTLAYGGGFSYAFERPRIEERPEVSASRLLKYFAIELEAFLPSRPETSLFVRIHHRSGIYGLLSDAKSTNFVGVGIRSHF